MKSESHSVVSDSLQPEFSKPAYGSGQPFPSAGDLPNPGIEPWSPALQVDSLPTEISGKPLWRKRNVKKLLHKQVPGLDDFTGELYLSFKAHIILASQTQWT